LKDSLKHKTINAISWSFVETIGLQLIQFIISIILARLLFPEQFGLIGMLTIFMAIAETFLNSGFGSALIQKRNPSQIDICSVFYFNIIIGIFMVALMFVTAPWIAAFYKQQMLSPLLRALSLIILINSFGLIQITIITKNINFKILTKVNIISTLFSGLIGVILAVNDYGVWSLAIQQITRSFLSTILLWILNSWRPTMDFSFKALKDMFRFGSRMLASGLLYQTFENIYLLIIGKLFSAADLGYFTRAQTLQQLPSNTLAVMVARVTFPVFSTIQDDHERLKKGMKKALTSLALINFPIMIGLSLISRPLIIILFTDKWIESVPYIQLLCFLGLLLPMHVLNLDVLQALGKSNLFLRLEVIKKVLIVLNIIITWRWGISAMIYGMIVTSVISYYLNSYYNKKLIKYGISEQLFDLIPYFIVSVLMGFCVYLVGLIQISSHLLLIICQIISGIFVYAIICYLFRLSAFMDLLKLLINSIIIRKKID
jgi:teichuronic acid exporter